MLLSTSAKAYRISSRNIFRIGARKTTLNQHARVRVETTMSVGSASIADKQPRYDENPGALTKVGSVNTPISEVC